MLLVSLTAMLIAGLIAAALLSGGDPDSSTTTPTIIGNVEGTAWHQMLIQLETADDGGQAETVRSDAQIVIDRGEPAAFDLETLRAEGERRAAEEWLAANCG